MIRILLTLLFIFSFVSNALAYEIIATDVYAYEFMNSQYKGKNANYETRYDVDIDQGVIIEKTVSGIVDGANINMPGQITFKIVENQNGRIVAVSLPKHGVNVLTLNDDGTFHFYQTLYMLHEGWPVKKGTSTSVVSFGTFKRAE
ncbi:MAG: hypothetical protein GF409_05810 [Candidatus Omnitrophica bacterium]|nr:hypothetical protein [Candidatus Omnitrophota bacterium]